MKMSRTQLLKNKEYSQNRINRLKHDVALSNENTKANFSLITEFFPAANIDKISEIENFHKKIGVILKREFEAEILTVVEQIDFFNVELDRIDSNIQNLLSQQGTPSDIFEKVFEIKQRSETAKQQNELYETEVKMASDVKTVKENLQAMQLEILESIAKKLNLGMRELTTKIFDNARQSPTISFATSNKYVFESPSDTGAGKSYINLICLDLSVLSFSKLPVIVHDSILFKNTEPSAFSKLVDIYDTFEKQIFISIDEGSKYGVKALNTLRKNLALEIDGENLLYTRDWRTKN